MAEIRPENVGILAMEIYTPKRFVAQEYLEAADGCPGKYTIGLGQLNMAFSDDCEDITSIFLTVVHSLLEKYKIEPSSIGRVEIGTETLIDKSKSVKTSLMSIFGDNTDLEGVTNVNACYGGTAALFNSLAWIESSDWDGRYALVVCGDIAVYEAGPARPTGGCGCIAMLLGADAPVVMEPGVRATHCLDVYDFYKPNHSEYAVVDGKLSQRAYLSSVDKCYMKYKQKTAKKYPKRAPITAEYFDYFAFHSPYNKLVQKGFGRLYYVDHHNQSSSSSSYLSSESHQSNNDETDNIILKVSVEDSYENREVDTSLRTISQTRFTETVLPGCALSRNIGNCYTASVFLNLLSILIEHGETLVGKRIGMFSFGSGSVASLYSFMGRNTLSSGHGFSLSRIQQVTGDISHRLSSRKLCSVAEFTEALEMRARSYGVAPLVPEGQMENLFPGTFYLTGVDEKHRRRYARTPVALPTV
mmetsp:Transcript_25168/g.25373  ORF Transcript_25168/g.25373 Transcript_25168/m.25373 type:complete len:472 (+) Transcript_25168:85-1500(+)|eukprot:CAMPEP_0182428056 /NCGR_PEP_ID=MMETSP1167-20130531/20986_1 /TAXON_ID=2988 /ORGANISM="Mallomonas Sp, Strain CCMP3275" /LENGTH=471 /DNA_ID=CAMNT_0024610701 /DNA_START=49 /DNA_END=1464 /DNA_ORIENTATION=-